MNAVLTKLWLWFWYLLPANPILVRVVQGASRRPRHLWLRGIYLGALFLVIVASLTIFLSGRSASLTELAKGASQTFMWASMVQLAMMCLLAPVFTAAAITQERDAQTFSILLSTPLTNAQIVLGSLISRLYFVILLLLAGLPIFLMTMVYGGVTQTQVFQSFALSGSTAVLTGTLAIFIAMIGVGTRRTIFSFYLAIALYLLALYVLGLWNRTWVEVSPANIAGTKMSWLAPLHPFLALDVAFNRVHAPAYNQLTGYSSISRWALSQPSSAYVVWTSMLAVLLTVVSVVFVRRGAKTGEATLINTLLSRLPGTRLGAVTRPPRHVWANPVAWREAKARVSEGWLLRWAVIVGGLVGATMVLTRYVGGSLGTDRVRVWLSALIMIQLAVALIIATNTAATSMTKEKESKTMDILLTTPLTSKYILWGKLRGLVSLAMPLILGPVVALLVFGVYGLARGDNPPAVQLETALELGALMVVYTAIVCVISLRISLFSRKNVTAVLYSVGVMILLFGIASLLGFTFVRASGGEFGAFLAPFTPFTAVQFLVDPAALFDTPKEFAGGAASARIFAGFGSAIALVLYAFLVYTIYSGLVRNFDMIVRKQSGT
ncbi:MAG: ABC transporter permease subunit [Planctomycetes bacterium]|nr:ABC transporter permease subunit [Planctomycetota bacterium]